ncbi:MAG: hypothetical protein H7256_05940, partial [Bdellovibrio sp.]|nr:hypothetical protein [Bdellovibrio sp.]
SFALKFGVRIYRQAINSNHIHLLLKITNRVLYRAFIKAVSGKIASHVMGEQSFKLFSQARQGLKALNKEYGAGDGSAERLSSSFWQFRPFSRLVNWGMDFKTCAKYLRQNVLEALGFAAYKPRKNNYQIWLRDAYGQVDLLKQTK